MGVLLVFRASSFFEKKKQKNFCRVLGCIDVSCRRLTAGRIVLYTLRCKHVVMRVISCQRAAPPRKPWVKPGFRFYLLTVEAALSLTLTSAGSLDLPVTPTPCGGTTPPIQRRKGGRRGVLRGDRRGKPPSSPKSPFLAYTFLARQKR